MFYGTSSPTSKAYCYPLPGIGKNWISGTTTTSTQYCDAAGVCVPLRSAAGGQDSFQGLIDSFARSSYTKIGNYLMANYYDPETEGLSFL